MKERFCGDDYKRTLQAKLRNLQFRKGTKIIPFVHELRTTVRELYGITTEEAIEGIAISHVLATLEDSVKKKVQVLQLAENQRLENLLELVDSLLAGNPLALSTLKVRNENTQSRTATSAGAATATSGRSYDKRLDRLENMFEKLMTRMDDASRKPATSSVTCDNCGERGYNRERCFKLKKCYFYGQMVSSVKRKRVKAIMGQIRYHQTIQTI